MALFRRDRLPEVRTPVEIVEQRDPTAATRSVRYTTKGMPQPPDWNAATAFSLANNTVLTCIDRLGSFLTKCPFRVGADPNTPDDYDLRSPLARLLGPPPGGPNPTTSGRRLLKWTVGQRMMSGRFAWEYDFGTGGGDRPVALWALPTSSLVPVPSENGIYYFDRFEYGRPLDRRSLPRDRVLYDWIPAPDDWRQPDPPLRAAYLDLLVAVMQSRYDYAFLKNDAKPATIIVTEKFAEEDDLRAFEQQWNSTYQGPDNAGKTVVAEVEGGDVSTAMQVIALGMSPKDAQAAQRYEFRLKQIAMALGVPWSILDASGRTFDNASQEWQNFLGGTLEPLACDLADAINMQLAPRFGPNVGWFDLRPLGIERRTDPVTSPATAPAMVQAQLMTIDEGRSDYGLPPLPNGTGARMMTAAEIAALRGGSSAGGAPLAVAASAPIGEARKLHEYDGDGGPCTVCEKPPVHQAHGYFMPTTLSATPSDVRGAPAPVAAPSAVEPPAPSVDPIPEDRGETAEEAEARRTKIWTANDSTVRNLERVWEKRVVRLFARQLRSVLARLEAKRGRQARSSGEVRALADEVFDPDHWEVETADEMRVLYEQIAATAGAKMADRFGVAFDLDAPYVQDFIDARANQLAGGVTSTTYDAIKAALTEGVSEGEGIPELADRIRHVFDVASTSRSTTIARTEVISAYNGAGTAVASSYGDDVVAGQEWIATRDARTREQHAERDGEIVPVGDTFSGGLAYPGDPSGDPADVVNCRCTVAYLTPDEMQRAAPRDIPVAVARAVLALVRPGTFDERAVRAALRLAA